MLSSPAFTWTLHFVSVIFGTTIRMYILQHFTKWMQCILASRASPSWGKICQYAHKIQNHVGMYSACHILYRNIGLLTRLDGLALLDNNVLILATRATMPFPHSFSRDHVQLKRCVPQTQLCQLRCLLATGPSAPGKLLEEKHWQLLPLGLGMSNSAR